MANSLVAIAIGFVGLTASCIYMENPWGVDQLFYGYYRLMKKGVAEGQWLNAR